MIYDYNKSYKRNHSIKFSLSKSKATEPYVINIDDRVQIIVSERFLFKIKNDIDKIIVKKHGGE